MMAGRSHRGERVPPASDSVLDRSQHGTGLSEHGGPAVAIQDGVEEEDSPTPFAHRLQPIQVDSRVDSQERLPPGRLSLSKLDARFLSKVSEQHAQPGGGFRVAGPRIMLQAAGVGEDWNGRNHLSPLTSHFSRNSRCISRASSPSARRALAISASRRRYHRQ
jgi:hypothetical protein